MPKFEVTVNEVRHRNGVVKVTAKTQEEANEKIKARLEDGCDDFSVKWSMLDVCDIEVVE